MEVIEKSRSLVTKTPVTKKITTINIENMPCYCSIGIHDEEKKMGQRLLIDIFVDVDSSNVASSDNLKDTFSYVDIYKTVQEVACSKSHSLIEALADEIVEALLKHKLVLKAKIKVHKPHIPFPEFQGDVSVEVEREQ